VAGAVSADVGEEVVGRRRERPGSRCRAVVGGQPEARAPGDTQRTRLDVTPRFHGVDPVAVVRDDHRAEFGAGRLEADDPGVADDTLEARRERAPPAPPTRAGPPRAPAHSRT